MENGDRFSDLPDSLAHHVFSFLTNIEDIARLRFTSKMFEELCLSTPSLIIDAAQCNTKLVAGSSEKLRFMDSLVSLIRRRRDANLKTLTISWSDDVELTPCETCRIMSMLNSAARCHVHELNLSLRFQSGGEFVMPLHLFYNLRSLKVNLMAGLLQLPNPCRFAHLESLHLQEVEIVHEDIGEWISSFCKSLKKLYLIQLSGISQFRISSSSLEYIEISGCAFHLIDISAQSLKIIIINRPFSSSIRASLNIYAPNVKGLVLAGVSSANYYSIGKMDLLPILVLQLIPAGVGRNNSNSLLSNIIAQTRCLFVTCKSIKVLYDEGLVQPVIFNKLEALIIYHCGLIDDFVPSMAMFFQELHRGLKTLCIIASPGYETETNSSSTSYTYKYGLKFWESHNFFFLDGLEEVEIDLVGGKNEEGLLEYILNMNANNLKRVIVCCGSPLPPRIINMLTRSNFRSDGGKILVKLKPDLNSVFTLAVKQIRKAN